VSPSFLVPHRLFGRMVPEVNLSATVG
jgi:hypothetical protein